LAERLRRRGDREGNWADLTVRTSPPAAEAAWDDCWGEGVGWACDAEDAGEDEAREVSSESEGIYWMEARTVPPEESRAETSRSFSHPATANTFFSPGIRSERVPRGRPCRLICT